MGCQTSLSGLTNGISNCSVPNGLTNGIANGIANGIGNGNIFEADSFLHQSKQQFPSNGSINIVQQGDLLSSSNVNAYEKQEMFISDNGAQYVKLFKYKGVFLRQIGGEGMTNYPIGVGINPTWEILVQYKDNDFNLTVFTRDVQLINALERKVKHAHTGTDGGGMYCTCK